MITAGRRSAEVDAWTDQGRLARTAAFLRGHAGLVPKGVLRLSSFEAADAWMTAMMITEHARRSPTTSTASAALNAREARQRPL